MKKLTGILALTASLPVFANGFYVGGHFGITSLDVHSDRNAPIINSTDSDVTYGAFAGYQFDLPKVFLAVEGDIFLGDTQSSRRIEGASITTKREQIAGLSGLLGINMNDYLALYGRLGWARTGFDFTEDNTTSESKKNGIVYGAGMRYEMREWLALRFDYRYVQYRTFEYANSSRQFDVNDQLVTVGIQYNF